MSRLAKLQLIGPVVVFLTVLAAEGAVYALAHDPRSEWLWYINIKLFGIFQRAHYILSDYIPLPASQLLVIAAPILALAFYGLIRKRAIALALASNLSFLYAGFVMMSWSVIEKYSLQASLSLVVVPSGPGLYTMTILLGASLLSFVISHAIYVGAIRAQT